VQSLLNKIAPDNLGTICYKLADIELRCLEELRFVINIVFRKALSEPHYCSTYADMMTVLRTCYPEFPGEDGSRPHSFTRLLLHTVQAEYEALPKTVEPTPEMVAMASNAEELALQVIALKKRFLANMKLIGHLFLRSLISIKIIEAVMNELLYCGGEYEPPSEHFVECVCELITSVGYTVDESAAGVVFMSQWCDRLYELQMTAGYSKRSQLMIMDVLDLRAARWRRKVFKENAKKVGDLHRAARRDTFTGEPFSFEIAGARPSNLAEVNSFRPPVKKKQPEVPQAKQESRQEGARGFGVDLCRSFLLGRCNRGAKCRFIHDKQAKEAEAMKGSAEAAVTRQSAPAPPAPEEEDLGIPEEPEEVVVVTPGPQRNLPFSADQMDRVLSYYSEDLDDGALIGDWEGMCLGPDGVRVAVTFMLRKGFSESSSKANVLARAVACLVRSGCIPEDAVFEPMSQCIASLEEVLIDNPHGKGFFYALAAEAMKERSNARWAFAPLAKHPQATLLTAGLSADGLKALQAAVAA